MLILAFVIFYVIPLLLAGFIFYSDMRDLDTMALLDVMLVLFIMFIPIANLVFVISQLDEIGRYIDNIVIYERKK